MTVAAPSTEANPDPAAPGPRFGHQPALEGLRGVAVGAVLLFHAGFDWAAGGFIGIDVFFVLSGFLITTLLLTESSETGGVSMRRFWNRRFRRLLPAVLAMLVVVAVGTVFFAEAGELQRIRVDGIATLLYVNNWAQIYEDVGYFDLFSTPSPLLHTWSLSVEEQYYVIWPVVIGLIARQMLRSGRRRRQHTFRRRVAQVATVGAIASACLMIAGWYWGWSISRLYFGTDTRAQALLAGSALAVLRWRRWRDPNSTAKANPWLDIAGLAGLVVVGAFIARHWADGFLNRGGYSLLAVAAAVVIAAATAPSTRVTPRVLAIPPLLWLGRISYGAYLWHWPIFVWLSEKSTGWGFWPVTAARFALTIAVSVISLKLIEDPFRYRIRWRPSLAVVASVLAGVAIVAATVGAAPTDADRFEADQERNAAPPTTTTIPPPATSTVLVVGDSLASSVARNWSHPELTIVDRSYPDCGEAATDPAACGQWTTDWPAAIAEVDPDITLLIARSWHALSQDPALEIDYDLDIAKPTNLLVDEVGDVADAAGAAGGSLVIATPPPSALDPEEAPIARMFEGVAQQTALVRPDEIAHVSLSPDCAEPCDTASAGLTPGPVGMEVSGLAAPTVQQDLGDDVRERHVELWDRTQQELSGTDGLTRLLMVGDSVGWSLGSYWWGQDGRPGPDDDISLWNRAQFFCELDDGPRHEESGKVELADRCVDWRNDWARYIDEFDPHVVMLMVGSWQVFDREVEGEVLEWGSPEYDEQLTGLLQEAVEILSAQGAIVQIATQAEPVMAPGDANAPREWWDDPKPRFDHMNALLREVAAANPQTTELIELASLVCPAEPCPTEIQTPGGTVALRPDGVHYGAAGGPVVAEWLSPGIRAHTETP